MYLTSVELLALSRMFKALRGILMTKSVRYIWKQARLNLNDFPDCPDDLNEVQFASLVFGTFCDVRFYPWTVNYLSQYCNKWKGRGVIWSNRRRCCGPCIQGRNGLVRWAIRCEASADIFNDSPARPSFDSLPDACKVARSVSWCRILPSINFRSESKTIIFYVEWLISTWIDNPLAEISHPVYPLFHVFFCEASAIRLVEEFHEHRKLDAQALEA